MNKNNGCPKKECPDCGNAMSVHDKIGDPVKVVYYKCDKCNILWQLLIDTLKLALVSPIKIR